MEILVTTYAIGNGAGLHLYYFALGGLSSLIHTRVRADVTFALATLSALLFLFCHFALDRSVAPLQVDADALTALFAISVLGTVFLCAYFTYGGEEFIAILPETSGTDAMVIAEKFRATVEHADMGEPAMDSGASPRITVSIGVSTVIPEAGLSPDTLISGADRALYEAKLKGRNQVVFCPPGGSPRQNGQTALAD